MVSLFRSRGTAACAAVLLLQGCVSQSQMQAVAPTPAAEAVRSIRVEPCTDRTGTTGRDLAAEATRLIAQDLRAAPGLALSDEAPWVLHCEVVQFLEGSALKRWVMPGWGSTVAQVALMLSNARDQSTVVIVRGNSVVSAGGLYTVGAEDYILKSAVDDAMARLRAWSANPGAVRDEP